MGEELKIGSWGKKSIPRRQIREGEEKILKIGSSKGQTEGVQEGELG